jgi:hypothetical protein
MQLLGLLKAAIICQIFQQLHLRHVVMIQAILRQYNPILSINAIKQIFDSAVSSAQIRA